ncbi:MAG: Spy/CpxP family protein refolding chaperone [Polyangiaceae bacterium]
MFASSLLSACVATTSSSTQPPPAATVAPPPPAPEAPVASTTAPLTQAPAPAPAPAPPPKHHHGHAHGVLQLLLASLDAVELKPEQKTAVDAIEADLDKVEDGIQPTHEKFVSDLADGVAAGKLDKAKTDADVRALTTAATSAQANVQDALNRLHKTLDSAQRKKLVATMKERAKELHEHHFGGHEHEHEHGGKPPGPPAAGAPPAPPAAPPVATPAAPAATPSAAPAAAAPAPAGKAGPPGHDGKGPHSGHDGKGRDGKGPDGEGPPGADGKGPDAKGPPGADGKGPDAKGPPGGKGPGGPDGKGPREGHGGPPGPDGKKGPGPGPGGEHGPGGHPMLAKLSDDLGLSPEQRDKLRGKLEALQKADQGPMKARMAAAEKHLAALAAAFESDTFDAKKAGVGSQAPEMLKAMASERVKFVEAVLSVLTVEQRAKFAAHLREHAKEEH